MRTAAADGYDAVQLAFEPVADRKLSKGELGHLKKSGVGAHRHLVEFRGESQLAVGETVTVESFEPGDRVKVAGVSIGKGFQGTIKRHNFSRGPVSHGSHNVRKPGSIGASATPSRVFKGVKMAGQMGAHRVTQVGLEIHEVDAERNLLLVKGSVPGPEERHRRDQGGGVVAAPKAQVLGGSGKDVSLAEGVFAAELKPHLVHETVRAELNARRAGTRGAKTRGLVAGGRAKPWRQKGTGRARQGTIRAAQFTGGGVVFAPGMRSFEVKVNRKARRAALARCALAPCCKQHAGDRRRLELRVALDQAGEDAREQWGKELPLVVVAHEDEETLIKSFRNLERVLVTVPSELEVAHIVWANSLLVSQTALPLVEARAGTEEKA